MPDLIGQRIGAYEIVALLGKGGMAEVYRARQQLGGRVARDVALKLIDARLSLTPEFISRFEREAQTLVSLSHPHILKAFDYGQYQDTVYLVMELLPGGSLAEPIRKGTLLLSDTSYLLEQIGQALDYAHREGVIHRDLKPQNVLFDKSGNAFLTDFGIVKLLGETTSLTQSNTTIGTPAYMAPEQWTAGAVDARTDLYALGVMLFEMLGGRVPFVGDTPYRVMYMHTHQAPPSVYALRPDMPTAIDRVIGKALAKDPAARYESAAALVADFKAALAGQPVKAPLVSLLPLTPAAPGPSPISSPVPNTPTYRSTPPTGSANVRRISPLLGVMAALIVILSAVGIGLAAFTGHPNPPLTASASPSMLPLLTTQAVALLATQPPIDTPTTILPSPMPTNIPTSGAAPATTSSVSPLDQAKTLRAQAQTQTATVWTHTPTPTFTPTANDTATLNANLTLLAATDTMQSELNQTATLWTPTHTFTPTSSPIGLDDAAQLKQIALLNGHTAYVNSVAWSPDGKTLASASWDNTVRLWDVVSGKLINTLNGHTGGVSSVAWSPDGKTLASASFDKTVRLWDVASGKLINTLSGHTGDVLSVAWSPDGKTLASASFDKTVRLWDVASGRLITTLNGHAASVSSVAWSPDGKTLASASSDETVRLWDVANGRAIATLRGHTASVSSVAWSPDGKTLASASFDETARLWDVASGKPIATLSGHTDLVLSVAWSPDGKILASASSDETVRLWDVASGRAIATLSGHTNEVYSVAWSPDGKTLASASADQTVRLWALGIAPSTSQTNTAPRLATTSAAVN